MVTEMSNELAKKGIKVSYLVRDDGTTTGIAYSYTFMSSIPWNLRLKGLKKPSEGHIHVFGKKEKSLHILFEPVHRKSIISSLLPYEDGTDEYLKLLVLIKKNTLPTCQYLI